MHSLNLSSVNKQYGITSASKCVSKWLRVKHELYIQAVRCIHSVNTLAPAITVGLSRTVCILTADVLPASVTCACS
ncbi:hypothetical protein DPMN_117963 [Dreissena polymorpha]|uniref:Uncharacterized protein n=1 Tax=Dreissena polymorpha TaxID=45954 RepID=A0A9D4GGI2_DREPO|nr:hypothetical protein DPMN_117963 [Dreissena polymorpha]